MFGCRRTGGAGSLLTGQADKAVPVVLIRCANLPVVETGSQSPIRVHEQDLFR
jgi:F420-0:gamma-glutamyl ligase